MSQALRFAVYAISMLFGGACHLEAQTVFSARETALAGPVLTATGAWSLMAQPAGLAGPGGSEIGMSISRQYLMKELNQYSLAGRAQCGRLLNVGLFASQYGNVWYNQRQYSGAFARAFGAKLRAGIRYLYSIESYDRSATVLHAQSVTAGVQLQPTAKMQVAASHSRSVSGNENQVSACGLAYQLQEQVLLLGNALLARRNQLQLSVGIEYVFMDVFYLRGGLQVRPLTAGFGLGFKHRKWMLEMSSGKHSVLGYSPVLTWTYQPANEKK